MSEAKERYIKMMDLNGYPPDDDYYCDNCQRIYDDYIEELEVFKSKTEKLFLDILHREFLTKYGWLKKEIEEILTPVVEP